MTDNTHEPAAGTKATLSEYLAYIAKSIRDANGKKDVLKALADSIDVDAENFASEQTDAPVTQQAFRPTHGLDDTPLQPTAEELDAQGQASLNPEGNQFGLGSEFAPLDNGTVGGDPGPTPGSGGAER